MSIKQKITPFLWFDDNVEEAMNLYVSLFPNSRIVEVTRYGEAGPGPKGTVMTGVFELDGQRFIGLNGGPMYKFTEAFSLMVDCDSQEEVDRLWDRLIEGGGAPSQCGWLKDRFGLSWQITPGVLMKMIGDKDRAAAGRAMQAMLKMTKIDIAALKRAFEGGPALHFPHGNRPQGSPRDRAHEGRRAGGRRRAGRGGGRLRARGDHRRARSNRRA